MDNNAIKLEVDTGDQPVSEKHNNRKNKNGGGYSTRNRKRMLFYILWIAVPILQYSIFSVYVNINSLSLAFQDYTYDNGYVVSFGLFNNIAEAWQFLISADSLNMIKNSLILFGCKMLLVVGLSMIFSYYIAKNYFMAGTFRVFLYIPHVVSSVVMALLFNYICTDVAKIILGYPLLDKMNPDSSYWCVLFYTIWVGFGTQSMLFTGAMSAVDPALVEAAQLDGANTVKEFIHIYIPAVWNTFISFVVVAMAGIFTDQMSLFIFFDAGAPFSTFGYFFFTSTKNSDIIAPSGYMDYPVLSALGLMISALLIAIILPTRKLLEKYGPRTD